MKIKNFNMTVSMTAFILGAAYIFSDGASVTANVIGATGSDAGVLAFIGIAMIIGSIGLFIVSMHSHDHQEIDLERLVRRNKHHHELVPVMPEEESEIHIRKHK